MYLFGYFSSGLHDCPPVLEYLSQRNDARGADPLAGSSFMIDQRPWIARGAILAFIGLVLILLSRRR